jgi:alpha-glucuronidase
MMLCLKKKLLLFLSFFAIFTLDVVFAEDGYRLWLRYEPVSGELLKQYRRQISGWMVEGGTPTLEATKDELQAGLNAMLDFPVKETSHIDRNGLVVAGTSGYKPFISSEEIRTKLESLGNEGFVIISTRILQKKAIIIASNSDIGVLYGVFHFLRLLQMHQDISGINLVSKPKINIRILNHWDNLDRTVERGYAGFSLWDWHKLPDYCPPVYRDYARANASIGINGTVLTNVNANALVLTKEYLVKVAALADVFRPYGIKVYLTARFSAPVETGALKTADPLNPEVIDWWKVKVKEIYQLIPDFGGFLVKANSEGQPGPQNYGRSHADGANMLAGAVGPFGGVVIWRAFVYDNNNKDDRAKQAYNEFVPQDGEFRDNVLIQVKNGPIDFQPREPFHPIFGGMPRTSLMAEFQITQEYLGFATHLVYLAPLYTECLRSDTWSSGQGSTVARIIDGSLYHQKLTGIAGVSNIGNERNWTGHPFAQANWYAFGRLAWNPYLTTGQIAEEWIRLTFSNDDKAVMTISKIMLASWEIAVNYMTPLGLHHIMAQGHHYGPGPWVDQGRADWTSVYYHRADSAGVGFDRSQTGSRATGQYASHIGEIYDNPSTCPENLLLWFHHMPWDYRMKSGHTLWDELCIKYSAGVDSVKWMQQEWQKVNGLIDNERFEHVKALLAIQAKEARWWRDACILYFQQFSKRPIPAGLDKTEHTLEYYRNLKFHFVPGI